MKKLWILLATTALLAMTSLTAFAHTPLEYPAHGTLIERMEAYGITGIEHTVTEEGKDLYLLPDGVTFEQTDRIYEENNRKIDLLWDANPLSLLAEEKGWELDFQRCLWEEERPRFIIHSPDVTVDVIREAAFGKLPPKDAEPHQHDWISYTISDAHQGKHTLRSCNLCGAWGEVSQ